LFFGVFMTPLEGLVKVAQMGQARAIAPPGQAQLSKIAFVRCKIVRAMELSQARIGPPGQEGGPSGTQAMPRSLLEARRVVVQVQEGFSFL
jgi:hypothetical protein